MSLYADDIPLSIENPKNSTQKLLKLINEFSKVAEDLINIQKSVAFLFSNSEILEKEYKNVTPFIILSQRSKYLRINLTKEVTDLNAENYKTLFKAIKEDLKKWKDIPCFWIRRINIVKMAILSKSLQIQCSPIKSMTLFTELEQTTPKFMWTHKRPNIAKASLRGKQLQQKNPQEGRGTTLPNFRQYYKATVIKIVWYCYQNRHTDQ